MASNLLAMASNSDGLQPGSSLPRPNSLGLRAHSNGPQPTSDGLQSNSVGLQPGSNLPRPNSWPPTYQRWRFPWHLPGTGGGREASCENNVAEVRKNYAHLKTKRTKNERSKIMTKWN